MSSIFSKIASNQIPSYKIAETKNYLAFLDVFPLKKGHVLVIPKKEVDYIFDLESEEYLGLMKFSREVALAIKKTVACKRISMHVIGLEVAHAHVHLIPINTTSDADFSKEKLKLTHQEFEQMASAIRLNIPLSSN